MSASRPGALGALARFYAGPLAHLERAIVVLLAVLVVLGGLAVASGRGLNVTVLDAATLQTLVFVLAFYLSLFGAILATRRAGHIAVDAITPHLPEGIRRRLEGALMLLSAAVALFIARAAWRYVGVFIPEDAHFIPGLESPLFSTRLWRWPVGLCFAWMAVHFAVGGAVRVMGREPWELGLEERPAPPHLGGDDGGALEGGDGASPAGTP